MISMTSAPTPRSAAPSAKRWWSRSIRSWLRFEPMACRSMSASPALKPPTSMAICMSCSWKSGTPSVFFSDGSSSGWR